MVVVSYSGKEINAKLVYYGPGLSGKTTNLESIYEAVPDTSRGKMVSMKTQSDRTLFFDLLPLDLGEIMGFKTRFLLYTVPGQVFYNATRKLVLKGADAVVFVADSDPNKVDENLESLANLRTNLTEYGVKLEELPWVLQYNKRDLPNASSIEQLNATFNPDGSVPFFEAVASQGKGVFETFRGVSHMLIEKVTRDLRRAPLGNRTPRASDSSPAIEMPTLPGPAPAAAPAGETPHAKSGDGNAAIDFGRELDLDAGAEARASAPPLLRRPEQSGTMRAPTPSSTHAAPSPGPASPATLTPEPFLTGGRSAASKPSLQAEPPATASASAAGPTEVVVPIELPRGASREIVLKIVITDSSGHGAGA